MFLVFSDIGNLVESSKPFKMSATEDSATVDLSKIKGKPVDAIGHMVFHIDNEQFKSPFLVEKIFGLVDVKTNAVFRFKLVISEDGPERIKLKLTYVSEEPIDCKIRIGNHPSEILEHWTISDEVKNFHYKKENLATVPRVNISFGISVFVIKTNSMCNVFARMFNNPSTSDFIVNCQGKQFFVHQSILRGRSEYFEAILHNDCIEKRQKMLKIDDFQPNVVEIFLRYLYNGAFPISTSFTLDFIHLLKIADKYNANELFDATDSYISQLFLIVLNGPLDNNQKHIMLKSYLNKFEEIKAPKFATMICKWRITEKGSNCLDDSKWSSLILKNPNFAMLCGVIFGRNDYQDWFQQHRSWWLSCKISTKRNDFAVLVGPIGEIKGAVKCSPI